MPKIGRGGLSGGAFCASQYTNITGSYKEFPTIAATGNKVYRGFCPECGTTLFGRNTGHQGIRPVSAASLDDPAIFQPNVDFWVEDAQSWDYMNPALPKFEKNAEHL